MTEGKPVRVRCSVCEQVDQAVAHAQSTDHRILRDTSGFQLPRKTVVPALVSFPESEASLATSRDLALAWETLAQRNVEGASREAELYLRKAVKERPDDAAILANLGFIDQQQGLEKEARELYESALKIDPLENDAATNLGTLEAMSGNLRRAVELWQGAFERVPNRSVLGMNLAVTFCAAGQIDEARRYVLRVLDFNPDLASAKKFLVHLNSNPAQCTF
jgi:Flp pilus assembly protein TadD